ncbi:MAG: SPFH domain-containing protein [Candidatus Sericytochromatia bacterium]|nr:SPFH domain-containing protein [Candidatus Sericytochromatia bacterium]
MLQMNLPARWFRLALGACLIIPLSGCPAAYVRQGHVGLVVDDFTGEIKHVHDPGIRAAIPLREHIVEFPVIVQQYVMVRGGERNDSGEDDAVRVNSLEGQTFMIDASVEFVLHSKQDVAGLYQRYGLPFDAIVERYFRSRFKAAIATAVASLPLNTAISGEGRRKVEQIALADLRQTMATDHIDLHNVLIRAVYLPEQIAQAISDKTRAENALEQSRTAARQQVVEAEAAGRAAVVAAEAEAKARLIRAKAEAQANRELAASLTDRLIRKLYIEKLSDKVRLVLPPGALYNLQDLLPNEEKSGALQP